MSKQALFEFPSEEIWHEGPSVEIPMPAGAGVPTERPATISERFHDAIVQYANSIPIEGPDEERRRDDFFNGLLDALTVAGLGDKRREFTTKRKR